MCQELVQRLRQELAQRLGSNMRVVTIGTILLLVTFWLFWKSGNTFPAILLTNQSTLSRLVPFIALFILIKYLFFRHWQDSPLTLLSIIFALLFFLIQNTNEIISRMQAIQITTVHNCGLVNSLVASNGSIGVASRFVDEVYFQNFGFIAETYGHEAFDPMFASLPKIQAINQLITPNSNNALIVDLARMVGIDLCDKSLTVMSSRSESLTSSSWTSAITKFLKDYLD